MNSLKNGKGVPLLNFVGGLGNPLLNFEGSPGVPLLNFRRVPGPSFKFCGGSRVRGPGPTFTPCRCVVLFINLHSLNRNHPGNLNW